MGTAKHRAIDRLRRAEVHERKARGARFGDRDPRARSQSPDLRPRSTIDVRRRPAAPDLHRLPSGALDRRAGGAHAAPARRPDDRARSRARSWSPEPTVAQRIVRAKRTLAEARVPFEAPERDELAERLASVLEVDLPDLQRGLRGDRRRRLDAARALRGGAPARPHPRRASSRRSRRYTASSL